MIKLSKLLIIALAVAGLIVLAVVTLILGRARPTKVVKTLPASTIELVKDVRMLSAAYNPNDRAIYFFDYGELKLSKVDGEGINVALSDRLSGIEEAIWSPDFRKVLLRNINDLNITDQAIDDSPLLRRDEPNQAMLTWLFDIESKRLTFLSSKYLDVVWDGAERIVYLFSGDQTYEVATADPDGRNFQTITRPNIAVKKIVARNQSLGTLFIGEEEEGEPHLYLLRSGDQDPTRLAQDVSEARLLGSLVVFEGFDSISLSAVNVSGGTKKALATFGSTIKAFSGWASKIVVSTEDGLFRVKPETSQIEEIDILAPKTIDTVIPSDSQNLLFFTAERTLYRVDLP